MIHVGSVCNNHSTDYDAHYLFSGLSICLLSITVSYHYCCPSGDISMVIPQNISPLQLKFEEILFDKIT